MASGITPLPKTMTAEEVAEILHTTPGALAQLRFRNEGPAYIKLGRSVRYLPEDVENYIKGARVQTRQSA